MISLYIRAIVTERVSQVAGIIHGAAKVINELWGQRVGNPRLLAIVERDLNRSSLHQIGEYPSCYHRPFIQ